jgi:PIN domain nuclease of toxin-antitoxin system
MRYLLDTHIFLWQIENKQELSNYISEEFENYSNQFYLSYLSLCEISLKDKEGKLKLSIPFEELVANITKVYGVKMLPFTLQHAIEHRRLIPHNDHRDPFDHIIISQAISDKLTLISADRKFPYYCSQGLNLLENN